MRGTNPKIRFGLGAIRGVGETALEAVLEAREAGGQFADLFEFAERVDSRRVNKGVLEALVQCGAFDASLQVRGISRARAFAGIDKALERSRRASRDREGGQTDLFGLFKQATPKGDLRLDEYPTAEPWDLRETLNREKQSLGVVAVQINPGRAAGRLQPSRTSMRLIDWYRRSREDWYFMVPRGVRSLAIESIRPDHVTPSKPSPFIPGARLAHASRERMGGRSMWRLKLQHSTLMHCERAACPRWSCSTS